MKNNLMHISVETFIVQYEFFYNRNARSFIQTSIILIILEIDSRLSLRVMINVTLRHSSSFFFASAIDSKTKTSSSASSSSAKSAISSNYFKRVSTFP